MNLEGDFWAKVRAHPGYAQSKRWQERYGVTIATRMDDAVILTCEPARVPPPPTMRSPQSRFEGTPSEERSELQRLDAEQWRRWYGPLEELFTLLIPTARWFRANARKLDAEQCALAERLEAWGGALYLACLRHADAAYWPVRYTSGSKTGSMIDVLQVWFPPAHERQQRLQPERPMEMPF